MKNMRFYQTYPFFILFLLPTLYLPDAFGSGIGKYESWYQEVWCEGYDGITEAKQDDGTRLDCLTRNHAIEMEFARNWREDIGQSLHYALKTERQAGIVLILQKQSDEAYWKSLEAVVEHYHLPITLWRLGP